MTERPDVVGIIVGRNIAIRRRQLGINSEQFSKCLGIDMDLLGKFETGVLRVDAKLLLSIGQILDMPPQYFFSSEEIIDTNTAGWDGRDLDAEGDRALFLKDGVALNLAFARISKSNSRRMVIDIACALADVESPPEP